jgi:hypothetical protein
MGKEKFPYEEAERLKQLARLEEQLPEADACEACKETRARSGDPTDLCPAHLKKMYGV